MSIADIRTDYIQSSLDENEVGNDPISFFNKWFNEAIRANVNEVNAMTLATVDENNQPHARIVLLKSVDANGFTFFTNYESLKGQNIEQNPQVAIVFFWPELERQIRIEGVCSKLSAEVSDEYYHSRPVSSQIGAWASPQSQVITSRTYLENREQTFKKDFEKLTEIPRPPHWGGFIVQPNKVEFWQGRASRLHDRMQFQKNSEQQWILHRLAP
jgi:pyridoxamine 5'-phosphate oxidase